MHGSAPPTLIEPDLLMMAYRSGIFPMADARDDPEVFWIEPRMRAIIPLDCFRLSRSLAKTVRQDRFAVTCNRAFSRVIEECAAPREGDEGSWISHRIQASYEELHRRGHAHSIECWQLDEHGGEVLAGGLYGVGFDRAFCGESMFSRVTDGSKVALAWLVAAMRRGGARLLDCQFQTPHLESLGAVEITQHRYLALLREAQASYSAGAGAGPGAGAGDALSLPEAFSALLADAAGAGLSSSPGKLIAQSLTQTS
jgi:leucyl/phenylalanyl-tRNA---protein transferase